MATPSIGSGLGGFAAIAPQPTYGGNFVTPTRAVSVRSGTYTINPHIVQGGPYLRNGGFLPLGSAHIQTWTDATGNLQGDVMNTGHALLFATAFGTSSTLTQLGTTTAYSLGGAGGVTVSAPDLNNGNASGTCLDMQYGVPDASGTVRPYSFHSAMITKAEWVFDRSGLVTYSYDWDAQQVENTTGIVSVAQPAAPVPFSMASASSFFKVGTYGAEVQTDGIRKCTITLDRKLAVDRIYLGNATKDLPVTNAYADLTVSIEADYTTAAKAALFDLFLSGAATSIYCEAVGASIAGSGTANVFGLQVSNAFVQTGGEAPLAGPDIVKNTISWSGTIDTAADPALRGYLITADTGF